VCTEQCTPQPGQSQA